MVNNCTYMQFLDPNSDLCLKLRILSYLASKIGGSLKTTDFYICSQKLEVIKQNWSDVVDY